MQADWKKKVFIDLYACHNIQKMTIKNCSPPPPLHPVKQMNSNQKHKNETTNCFFYYSGISPAYAFSFSRVQVVKITLHKQHRGHYFTQKRNIKENPLQLLLKLAQHVLHENFKYWASFFFTQKTSRVLFFFFFFFCICQ